jgi:hypothetical protein
MQEGLRAYIVHDIVPAGCIAFEIEDESCDPHVYEGEFVVVDTQDRAPEHGDLFLMQWESGRRAVVELFLRESLIGAGWWVSACNRPRTTQEWQDRLITGQAALMSDGPYAAHGPRADYFLSKIVGRVVGILEPDFRIGRPTRPEAMR